jgi:hypothetical protein
MNILWNLLAVVGLFTVIGTVSIAGFVYYLDRRAHDESGT